MIGVCYVVFGCYMVTVWICGCSLFACNWWLWLWRWFDVLLSLFGFGCYLCCLVGWLFELVTCLDVSVWYLLSFWFVLLLFCGFAALLFYALLDLLVCLFVYCSWFDLDLLSLLGNSVVIIGFILVLLYSLLLNALFCFSYLFVTTLFGVDCLTFGCWLVVLFGFECCLLMVWIDFDLLLFVCCFKLVSCLLCCWLLFGFGLVVVTVGVGLFAFVCLLIMYTCWF